MTDKVTHLPIARPNQQCECGDEWIKLPVIVSGGRIVGHAVTGECSSCGKTVEVNLRHDE